MINLFSNKIAHLGMGKCPNINTHLKPLPPSVDFHYHGTGEDIKFGIDHCDPKRSRTAYVAVQDGKTYEISKQVFDVMNKRFKL